MDGLDHRYQTLACGPKNIVKLEIALFKIKKSDASILTGPCDGWVYPAWKNYKMNRKGNYYTSLAKKERKKEWYKKLW